MLKRASRPGDQLSCDAPESIIERSCGGRRIELVELSGFVETREKQQRAHPWQEFWLKVRSRP